MFQNVKMKLYKNDGECDVSMLINTFDGIENLRSDWIKREKGNNEKKSLYITSKLSHFSHLLAN